jgi:hypothetical protein
MRDFIGRDGFTWFVGVVEDRDDPVQLGRLRVRCFGYHTEKKSDIRTEDLPWAQVMNGVQSASVNGLGFSPTGIVEGSWVIGFFIDGDRAQEPVIMGTLPGIPSEFSDPENGFNDPTGTYPKSIDDSDVNTAAREDTCADHPSRSKKNANRINDNGDPILYPTATPPKLETVAPDKADSYYRKKFWKEKPAADDVDSWYPYNHVRETESGHLEEFDDTPDGRRYHRFHPSGSYEEIINDGTRSIKIIGDDNEIVIQGKNMYIGGDLNVTVEGTKRELVKGNYHLEVEGETTFDLKSSFQTKVGHNQETEVGKARATNVKDDDLLSVATGDSITNINSENMIINIKKDYILTTQDDIFMTSSTDTNILAKGDFKLTNFGTNVVTSGGVMRIDGSQVWINDNHEDNSPKAARLGDTADTGDDPPGISGSDGSNIIETGSATVFIGD